MNDINEQRAIAVTKLELQFRKFLKDKRREMLGDRRARNQIEKVLKEYILQDKTLLMFNSVGMTVEYTNLLNAYTKALDGDLK